ncbi:heavy-metal-associated domain-containing protein [Algibacter sp. L1A34]|uniref:heavy-metal-associated domain-containing protein n=1 Tax=Algibacter sp. L1A34 TaxID=2686365 RepID=UPI00131AF192|nr:heavy-metal-associated domain-containing protein [Algibacter sp. L1A34]
MGFLEKNLIPGIHGMVFTINTKNEKDRAKVKKVLLKMPEIADVIFNTEAYPEEMTVSTNKVIAVEKLQKALIPYSFHALRKTLTGY